MALPEEAREAIRHFVWSGFYAADEIKEILCEEAFEPGELDEDEVSAAVAREWETKTADERAWPAETDCDRLDRAFDALNKLGIVALHNAGYTQTEGLSDVTGIYHQLGGAKSKVVGYCFYHGQDLERAVAGSGLHLTFGDINGEDEAGIEIGKTIRGELNRVGFPVEWDGSVATRIYFDLIWQKRYEDEA